MVGEAMGKVSEIGSLSGTRIYRYLPIDRLLDMIETGKNTLVLIAKWEDPNEAYLIRANVEKDTNEGDSEKVGQWYDRYRAFYGQSWTFKGEESDVFWRAYGNRGDTARIGTTVQGLRRTLDRLVGAINGVHDINAYMGAISYVTDMPDWRDVSADDTVKTLFVKRMEFSDEKEFRILAQVIDHDGFGGGEKHDAMPTVSGGLMKFTVALSDVIDSILIDPCCNRVRMDEIICRTRNVGFDVEIKKSRLFEWPRISTPSNGSGHVQNKNTNAPTAEPNMVWTETNDVPEVRFWRRFQRAYRNGNSEFTARRPPDRRYWSLPVGNGMFYTAVFNRDFARVELYIDSPDKKWNERVCGEIWQKMATQGNVGDFKCEFLESRRASRISCANNTLRFTDEGRWDEAIGWLCKAFDELRAKTEEHVKKV